MRTPKARPVGEHLTVLTRLLRQVDVSEEISPASKRRIKEHLTGALRELQTVIMRPANKGRERPVS
jgi:hypothetical protein